MSRESILGVNDLEVFCFGCIGSPGHYFHAKSNPGRIATVSYLHKANPWGHSLDGGLLKGLPDFPDGRWVETHQSNWTAVSFWDRSGDSRPGSNTSFMVHANIPGPDLIDLARVQWPEVFARAGFPALSPEAFHIVI